MKKKSLLPLILIAVLVTISLPLKANAFLGEIASIAFSLGTQYAIDKSVDAAFKAANPQDFQYTEEKALIKAIANFRAIGVNIENNGKLEEIVVNEKARIQFYKVNINGNPGYLEIGFYRHPDYPGNPYSALAFNKALKSDKDLAYRKSPEGIFEAYKKVGIDFEVASSGESPDKGAAPAVAANEPIFASGE